VDDMVKSAEMLYQLVLVAAERAKV
jgi:hypothetical protein